MTKSILIVSLILGSVVAKAQVLPMDHDTLQRNREIISSNVADFGGSALENSIMNRFLFGGHIDENVIKSSFDRHRNINRIGAVIGSELEYRDYNIKLFKKKNWGMVFKAGYNIFGGAIYSQDAFGLVFYGNDRYVGDTMSLSGMDITSMTYQKVGFGVIDAKSKSSLSFNLYNISNRVAGDFRSIELGQNSDGTEVNLEMDGSFERSVDSSLSQGLGFGVDADFRLPVNWGKEAKAYLQFKAVNLGFAYMHNPQQRYTFDTTFIYDGFAFDQLIGDNAMNLDSVNILDTLGIQSSNVNRTVMLPGMIQIGKIVDNHSDKMVQSFFGIRMYPTLIFNPYVYGGADFKVNNWFRCGANLGYGGFQGIRGGVYAHMNTKYISAGIGTENIIGAILKSGSGQSIYLRLRCAF